MIAYNAKKGEAMKKSKVNKTYYAFLASFLSLILCLTALMGSTYAWFTTSASTGVDTIQSGTLSVSLEYAKQPESSTELTWSSATSSTDMFSGALWEPGHTEIVYLEIMNTGDFALKYNLYLNYKDTAKGTNAAGNEIALSSYLKYGLISLGGDTCTVYTDSSSAISKVSNPSYISAISGSQASDITLNKNGDKTYYALVVWMPDDENSKNVNYIGDTAPEIALSINAQAKQNTVEYDSFSNDYDTSAEYNKLPESMVINRGVISTAFTSHLGSPSGTEQQITLDASFEFLATDTADTAQQSDYANWIADWVVSADKNISAGNILFAGNYGSYGWVHFANPEYIANTEIGLMQTFDATLTYTDICTDLNDFKCGIKDYSNSDALVGTKVTVKLCLFEPELDSNGNVTGRKENGQVITISEAQYTFPVSTN